MRINELKWCSFVICEMCSGKVPEGANYCPSCGARVDLVRKEKILVSADDLVSEVKELIHEGNVTRIVIRDEGGKVLLDMPVTVGVLGFMLAPWLAAVGAVAALATKCTIVVERLE